MDGHEDDAAGLGRDVGAVDADGDQAGGEAAGFLLFGGGDEGSRSLDVGLEDAACVRTAAQRGAERVLLGGWKCRVCAWERREARAAVH